MTDTSPAEPVYALLTDGTEVAIRELGPGDVAAVRVLHRGMSEENLYLRFFGIARQIADEVAERICRAPGPGHAAQGVWLADRLVGVANYEPTREAGVAEIALVVEDALHHRGIGTLLLEHLASLARARGVHTFRADTLARNYAMQRVFAAAGLPLRQTTTGGVVEVSLPLAPDARYLDAVAERERHADVASLVHVLRPSSIAVVGAGRRPNSIGAAILGNVVAYGFTGPVYAVNPRVGGRLGGVPCVRSPLGLPVPVDLAVIATPRDAVVPVAEDCGRRGVRALVVITSGVDGPGLLAVCHRYGMRLVGPNCLGLSDTMVRLDATFSALSPDPGAAGVVVQSGGVGIALRDHLTRLGVGVSSFVSVGDKYDVSGNDLLQWWESDGVTRLGILYVESFGNPRKFARTAQRVARRMPLLTVIGGRSAAGRSAAASHTAAAATPAVTREALFRQAGIIATHSLGHVLDATALLACQPVPAGPRVGIVTNAGGAGVLAADACADAGLVAAELSEPAQAALRRVLPAGAACAGPVDTTAGVAPETFRRCLELVAADDNVDALIAMVAPTAAADLTAELVAGDGRTPQVAVLLGQPESVIIRPAGDRRRVPSYSFPEDAARALAAAWSYGAWLARPAGRTPALPGVRTGDAARVIGRFLADRPGGGWLPPATTMELLGHYGLPLAPWRWATSAAAAGRAAAGLGGPVALKAHITDIVHKTEAGAVELALAGPAAARSAFRRLTDRFGDRMEGVLVQAMAAEGVEVLCGITQEPVFGPLVVFGLGGVATDVLGDSSARLTPLTDQDATDLIASVRSAPMLLGHRGAPPVDVDAVRDILLRLSRLADDHPDVAELDLNPVIATPDGAVAVDARVRVVPQRHWDPYLRRLR